MEQALKYIKSLIIIIFIVGAGMFLYFQMNSFFIEREAILQIEIQQVYDIGVKEGLAEGKIDLYNEWKKAGRQEVIDNIANQLLTTNQLKIVDDKGNVKAILIPKPNEPAEPTE